MISMVSVQKVTLCVGWIWIWGVDGEVLKDDTWKNLLIWWTLCV